MAPAEKTETTVEVVAADRSKAHHEGNNSGAGRGFASPLWGDDHDRGKSPSGRGRTSFASVGGWVVSQ